MKTLVHALMATTALAFTSPASAAESAASDAKVEMKANGGYHKEANAQKVMPDGTETSHAEEELTVDDDGAREKTSTTTETKDPKGLFNKDTVKTKTTETLKDGKLSVESKKTVNGKTVEETSKRY